MFNYKLDKIIGVAIGIKKGNESHQECLLRKPNETRPENYIKC